MLKFVNAKINIGLFVTARRPDGYHELETLFCPVGLYNGTPGDPSPFCDILEAVPMPGAGKDLVRFSGRRMDCEPEKNLVVKALRAFREATRELALPPVELDLVKHLPDGAGLGGGSADATFTLRLLNELSGNPLGERQLHDLAAGLGADCPFFLLNRPALGCGIGEKLEEVPLVTEGLWCGIVKPDLYISTREAFAGITPQPAGFDLRKLPELPVGGWRECVKNDFEDSLFPRHPELKRIKETLYGRGALYASMSGSGSSIYGLFADAGQAAAAMEGLGSLRYLCKL